jgi:hypothetical protein
MRIAGPNVTARVTNASSTGKRAGSGTFSVAEQSDTQNTAPAAALRTIGGIDALIALQGEENVAERRKRAVKKGRNALDALDQLKVELLSGDMELSTLARLKSGDPRLDGVMAEIDLRLQVEIAKMTPRERGK